MVDKSMSYNFTIGYERNTYAEERLFINKCSSAIYEKVNSIEFPSYPEFFNQNELFNSSWINRNDKKVDLVHYFNQINFGDMPFVVTYETKVPRFWTKDAFEKGIEILLSDTCLQIISMSKSCYDIQQLAQSYLSDNDKKILIDKTLILHPPQELLPNNIERFEHIEKLKLVFVGRDFINKGGVPMLLALKNLINKGFPLELYLVSNLRIIDNTTNSTEKDIEWIKSFINENKSWIYYYQSLTNSEVLSLISSCHIGLLPTLAETYGYSVLEMQAAGVPVISTNIRALAEINHINWQIPLPYTMRPIIKDETSIPSLYEDVRTKLESILEDIFHNLSSLKQLSYLNQGRIYAEHNLEQYSNKLYDIYSKAL